jgi:DNA-binding transcriptional ArsR family regulator
MLRNHGFCKPSLGNNSPDLFGYRPNPQKYPLGPGWKRTDTSRQAAKAIRNIAKTLQLQVLKIIAGLPAGGELTADEIAARLNKSQLSIRPRVSELAALGKIERTRQRGRNDSGMSASRWRISQEGDGQ